MGRTSEQRFDMCKSLDIFNSACPLLSFPLHSPKSSPCAASACLALRKRERRGTLESLVKKLISLHHYFDILLVLHLPSLLQEKMKRRRGPSTNSGLKVGKQNETDPDCLIAK